MKRVNVLLAHAKYALGFIIAFSASTHSYASISNLLITEIMANPAAVSDTSGEWFELFNPTAETVNLDGIILSDAGSNSVTLSGDNLLINSGSYFVLGRNNDFSLNGGLNVDYSYGSGFSLGNTSDEIIFSDSSGELLRLDYSSGFVTDGASMELLSEAMLTGNYAASTTIYGNGDFGTPGTAGSYAFSVAPSPVPLPGTAWLLVSGLIGLTALRKKHR